METEPFKELKVSVKNRKLLSSSLLESVLGSAQVREYFQNSRFRVLETQFFETDVKERTEVKCHSNFSNYYEIIAYDYTRSRTVHIKVKSRRILRLEISESSYQPEPNDEE